jgi:hypothetical protein
MALLLQNIQHLVFFFVLAALVDVNESNLLISKQNTTSSSSTEYTLQACYRLQCFRLYTVCDLFDRV